VRSELNIGTARQGSHCVQCRVSSSGSARVAELNCPIVSPRAGPHRQENACSPGRIAADGCVPYEAHPDGARPPVCRRVEQPTGPVEMPTNPAHRARWVATVQPSRPGSSLCVENERKTRPARTSPSGTAGDFSRSRATQDSSKCERTRGRPGPLRESGQAANAGGGGGGGVVSRCRRSPANEDEVEVGRSTGLARHAADDDTVPG